MNYLAHIFLSGGDADIQLGNFIADAVKGGRYNDYPPRIAQGILMHRMIDDFTDNHPAVKEVVRMLRPRFGRYSPVLADIFFDYLLASRWEEYSDVPLKVFARRFYRNMMINSRYLPPRMKGFMWHFIGTNRLYRYASKDGIGEALSIMSEYGRLRIDPHDAVRYLEDHEEELRTVFHTFFGELRIVCHDYLS